MRLSSAHIAAAPGRAGIAALEFALVAPILAIMLLSVFDGARALVAWQQTENAAQAVAQAAEKLSVSADATRTALTWQQMQNAMTTIYAAMPGLRLGSDGVFNGKYSVTLSEIEYYPQCASSDPTDSTPDGCGFGPANPQIPYVLWTTYLQTGGKNLAQSAALYRQGPGGKCTALTRAFPTWNRVAGKPQPNRLQQMVDPSGLGTIPVVLTPQIVADVQYEFKPTFAQLLPARTTINFVASAMLATPFGDNKQLITYTPSGDDPGIQHCTVPPR